MLLLECYITISLLNVNVVWSSTKKICLKESEIWRKIIWNKIIVTLVTQGLLSSFLALLSCCISSVLSIIIISFDDIHQRSTKEKNYQKEKWRKGQQMGKMKMFLLGK